MKKNTFETALYSVIGVLVLLGVLVAFNVVTAAFKQRVDLTKEKAYTLTAGTRAILAKLDSPATIRFYYSSSAELPSDAFGLKIFAQEVADLLAEYKTVGGNKLVIQTFDPRPDSDAEDKARLDGMEGQPLPNGEKFYLGLCVSRADASDSIAFLRPDRERLLEYDISRSISRVETPEKPVIGIMTGLPMFGMPSNPMMEQMGQRGQAPWAFVSMLQDDYTVKQVDLNAEKIDDSITLLIVFRPKDISDRAQYAIDQFLMRGGKLAAFLDTVSMTDKGGGNPMMGGGGSLPGTGTSLDKLLKAWGIQFDTSKAVADMNFMNQKVRLSSGDNPGWISLAEDGMNKNDTVTSELGELWVPFAGAFTGTPAPGLTRTVLLKSSPNSELVESMMASMAGESVIKDFKKSDTEYAMAIRLTGKFKTAFPDGQPQDKSPDDTNKVTKAEPSLKESKTDTAVVLVGDTDMFADQFCIQQMRTPFGNIPQPMNANLNLAQNIVENLSGDSNLINVRSRASLTRPFTRIRAMEAKAGEASQRKINDYLESLQDTQQKLAELEQKKQQGQQQIESAEEKAEKIKFEKKVGEINRGLRQERKNLAREKEALQNKLKWANILVMPVAVTVFGIGLATFKRKRTSAK